MAGESDVSARPPRLCRDCRHARLDLWTLCGLPSPRSTREAWRLACCLHPRVQPAPLPPLADYLVTGELAMPDPLDFVLCAIERGNEREGHCGTSGRLWEAT